NDEWYIFDGKVWTREQLAQAFDEVRNLARKMAEDASGLRSRIAQSVGRASFIEGVLKHAQSDPSVRRQASKFNQDRMLLGKPSGVVDLRTGLLRPNAREDLVTLATTIAPAGAADCPRWEIFID